jgi:hypothetical protein
MVIAPSGSRFTGILHFFFVMISAEIRLFD